MTDMTLDIVRLLLFPTLMAFAAASDLFTMTISNRISLLLLAGFLLLAVVGGMSAHAVAMHLAAGVAVLAVTFTCFAMGWIGGGDAKLAAATALWFGFEHLLMYLAYASVAGGILTILILQWRQWPLPQPLSSQPWLQRLHDRKAGVPYGIALAIGALLIYPETEWMKAIDLSRFAGT
jgi:prepilin peptidase CpaA